MATRTRKSVDAPFGFKADGTPRKRPVPTWLNGDNKPAKAAKTNGGRKTTAEIIASADDISFADEAVTVKPRAKRAAKAAVTVKSTRATREQDSVTATMIRGKRDWKTRNIDTNWMPARDGGVRFEEEADNGRSPHFMMQDDFAAIGSPEKIRVTVKALA